MKTEPPPKSRGPVYRADLLTALATLGGEIPRELAAKLCGFQVKPTEQSHQSEPPITVGERPPPEPPLVVSDHGLSDRFRFWRAEEIVVEDEEASEERHRMPEAIRAAPSIRDENLKYDGHPSPGRPLIDWFRLWPFLRNVLGRGRPSRQPDMPRVIRLLAEGRPLVRLPRKSRPGWHPTVHILQDRRPGLAPFWNDFDHLIKHLTKMRSSMGLHVHCLVMDEDSPSGFSSLTNPREIARSGAKLSIPFSLPTADSVVLALSDLNQYQAKMLQAPWLALGRRLRNRGVTPWALCPCPRERWSIDMASAWNLACWDRGQRPHFHDSGQTALTPDESDPNGSKLGQRNRDRMDRLFPLLAPAIRVEWGLLRDLRLLLSGSDADVGTEYDFLQHPDIRVSVDGISLKPALTKRLREMLEAMNPALLASVVRELRRHHGYCQEVFGHMETLGLKAFLPAEILKLLRNQGIITDDDDERAQEFWRGLVRAIYDRRISLADETADFGGRDLDRLTGKVLEAVEMQVAWALTNREETRELPDWVKSEAIAWMHEPDEEETKHQVCFSGGLVAGEPEGRLPVGFLKSRWPVVTVSETHGEDIHEREMRWSASRSPDDRALREADAITFKSGREALRFTPFTRPPWARRMWYDGYGLAAEFVVAGVPFVLRWIPPGRFLMGSPEGEPRRYPDEGPQHEVTISQGFWLGETPVTQAQWQAVMGENPSHFEGPTDLPVESVSWQVCADYHQRLARLVPGLPFFLPTEAQWEYACRAGTETALYSGGITITSEGNAPELEPIAWYNGNGGQDLDVTNPDAKAGTHRVKLKQANPWGLHDMLGNVWEWCADVWEEDAYQKRRDGVETSEVTDAEKNAIRVVRGGSWDGPARGCRVAFRIGFVPGLRRSFLGLRLAAGQEPEAAEPHSAERPSRRMAEGRSHPRNPAHRAVAFFELQDFPHETENH